MTALDVAACGLMRTSDDGVFIEVNHTFCSWIGVTAADLIGTRRLADLMTVGGRIFHQTHWAPLLRMQGSISEVKLDLVHRDGSKIPMVLNAVRRTEGDGMVHEVAAFMARDRDRYEKELLRSRQRLEDLVRELNQLHADAKDRALFAEQMIGIVSHDLRNPLSTIQMGATLLTAQGLPDAQLTIVARMSRATDRASRLIAELLDFTQARLAGGLPVTLAPIDFHAVIADTLDELRLAFPERSLVHVREGTGAVVADAMRLAQVVGNLVANAVSYGDPARPITIVSSISDPAWSLRVHNDGPPIPVAQQATIFEPMNRGTTATAASTAKRSVGLGLYIVREIAKAHHGTAAVTSEPGAGTTFTLAVPRA